MPARIARSIAWLFAALYIILSVIGLYLQGLTHTTPADMAIPLLPYFVTMVVVSIWPMIGARIISRHPRHAVGWLLNITFPLISFVMFAIGYASYAVSRASGWLPIPDFILFWLKDTGFPIAVVALTIMYLLFPTGRLQSPRWRIAGWLSVASLPVMIGLLMVKPGPLSLFPVLDNPDAIPESAWAGLYPLYLIVIALLTSCNLAAVISLFVRLRKARGDEAQQVKWLVFPALLYWIGILVLHTGDIAQNLRLTQLGSALHLISVPAIVLTVAFAIFKYRLYDADIIIRRTFVYGTLVAIVVVLYVIVVGGVSLMIHRNAGLAGLLITGALVGVIFQPMRTVLQKGVDRLLDGGGSGHSGQIYADLPSQQIVQTSHSSESSKQMGRWMTIARAAWYPVAVLAFTIEVFSIPGFISIAASGVTNPRFSENPALIVDVLTWVSVVGAAVVGLLSLLMAVLIFRRRSGERMALLTSFFLLVYGVVMAGPVEGLEPFLPGIAQFNTETLVPLAIPFILLMFVVFPDGRFVPPWSRWAVLIAFMATPTAFIWSALSVDSPLDFSRPSVAVLTIGVVCLAAATWGSTLYAQIYRYRRVSTRQQRQQTKWVIYGLGVWFTAQAISTVPWVYAYSLPEGTMLPVWLAAATPLWVISIAAIPITLSIAVLRYRLFEIDFLINRSLLYGALTLTVVAVYVLVVGSLGAFFQTQGNILVALLATGLVAALFQPLRERLQRSVNRLIYGDRDDPIEALARLGKSLESALPPDQALLSLVKTIAQTLKLPYVGIALGGQPIAAVGDPNGTLNRFPLAFRGETVGELLAAPRSPDESFNPSELRLLRNLARQAGAAVRNAQLAADLQRSRQNLVTAREEERHRLHIDLHDGVGPTMAGITLKLDAARDLVSAGLETGDADALSEALQLLTDLRTQTQNTVQDIRHIVHALRPPALDVLGLAPALQAHFGQIISPAGLDIQMTTDPKDLPRLSAAIEVATYRIVLEAVTNVIQHAEAAACQVSLSINNGRIQIEVADDGTGIREGHSPGVGLSSMRERAEELGGRFELVSAPGGTRMRASIPLPETEQPNDLIADFQKPE